MKHLLNGVAIAAALAIAAPVWAQAPKSPPAAAPAAKAPTAAKQAHHRPARHMARRGHHRRMSKGDMMTEQLNREELARIQGGSAPPPPPPKAVPFQGARPGPSH
jgi:hypothetical protein